MLLKNVLHVPQAIKRLAYVHKLTIDNDFFLELHPTFFLSRIGSRDALFFMGFVKTASTQFPPSRLPPASYV
jgi:hypothetical protein